MPQNKENLSANDAWKAIIEKYHILEHIEKDGCLLYTSPSPRDS